MTVISSSTTTAQLNDGLSDPISVINLTGSLIQLAPISPSSNGSNANEQPQVVRLLRVTPAMLPPVTTIKPEPNSTPANNGLLPCCVCNASTTNSRRSIPACTNCDSVFRHMIEDIATQRRRCSCQKSATKSQCSSCRMVKATESALSKFGTSISERGQKEWTVVDHSLEVLAKTACTLSDIVKVHEEHMIQMYMPSNTVSLSPTSKNKVARARPSTSERIPTGSFKRRAIDQQSWVQMNTQQIASIPQPRPPPVNLQPVQPAFVTPIAIQPICSTVQSAQCTLPINGETSLSFGDGTDLPLISSTGVIVDAASLDLGGPIAVNVPVITGEHVRKDRMRTLLKDNRLPVTIYPKPSPTVVTVPEPVVQATPLSEEEIVARRFSRLIKPSFMQVYAKHYDNVRSETNLCETAMDNHATLFQLFEFYDWEWNQPIEVSQSVRQACWSVFHEQLNESLTDMVRFIKRIPGFPILKPQDRILLVRNSGFELAFMVHYLYWNTEFGTWHGPENFVLTLEQLATIFPSGELFFRYGFANAKRLSKLTQQLQHLGLMAALVVLNTDLPNLSDRETVEALRTKIMNSVKYNFSVRSQETETFITQVWTTLSSLREMGCEHRNLLESLRDEDCLEFPDDLYAELFELIAD